MSPEEKILQEVPVQVVIARGVLVRPESSERIALSPGRFPRLSGGAAKEWLPASSEEIVESSAGRLRRESIKATQRNQNRSSTRRSVVYSMSSAFRSENSCRGTLSQTLKGINHLFPAEMCLAGTGAFNRNIRNWISVLRWTR